MSKAVFAFIGIAILAGGCGDDVQELTVLSIPTAAETIEKTPDPSAMGDDGWRALQSGDVDKADELARGAIAAEPGNPQLIFLMASVLAEQNRFFEANKMLEDLAEKVPQSLPAVMGQTAEWMVLQGRWIDAEERCRQILQEQPDAVPVHHLLVQLYTRQGRRLDAARHLRILCRQGIAQEPELQALIRTFYSFSYDADEEEFEPIGELGLAHYEISAGDWDAAAGRLEQLSDRNPAESALLGRILAHRQQYDSLSQWAADVPEAAKLTSDYWFAMGAHQAQQGDHGAAIKSFCATVARDPTDDQAYLLMSRSLQAIGADAQAQESARRAELIQRTKTIARSLEATPQRDLQQMAELVDLLDQLQRPFEALSWRSMLVMYGKGNVTQPQAQQLLAEINQRRLQYLQSNQPIPSRTFLLCGITPEILQGAADSPADSEREE